MEYTVIELAPDEVVVARFRQQRGELAFLGATRRSLDGAETLEEVVRDFAAQGAPGSRTVLALPPAALSFRELEIPLTDRRKLREILPLELKGETALPTEELLFDAVPLGGGRVMAVWCRRRVVADLVERCSAAGLDPHVVTVSAACWGSLLPAGAGGCVAVADRTAFVAYRDGQPFFFRALDPADGAAGLQRTAAALALGRDVTLERIYRHGPDAGQTAAAGDGVPVVPLPVPPATIAAFESETAARDLAGCRAVAAACQTGAPLNFRYGDLAHTAENLQLRKQLRLTLLLAGLLAAVLFVQAGLRYYLVNRDLKSIDSSLMAGYHELFPTRKTSADPVGEIKAELRQMGGAAASQEVLRTLRTLAEAKGDDVTGIYEVALEAGRVTVKGDARSIQAVNGFRTRLAGTFAAVDAPEQKSKPDGSVSFTMRATLKEEGK